MGWMRGAEGSGDDGKGRSIRTIFIFCLSSCKGIQFAIRFCKNVRNDPAQSGVEIHSWL